MGIKVGYASTIWISHAAKRQIGLSLTHPPDLGGELMIRVVYPYCFSPISTTYPQFFATYPQKTDIKLKVLDKVYPRYGGLD